MKEEVHNWLDTPSSGSSAEVLYHAAIAVAPAPSNFILPLASNRKNVHSPSIIHHSPVWLSLYTIFPFVGDRISTWPGNPLDHHVFESLLISQRIAQAVSTRSTVHLLSFPHLLLHLQATTSGCQSLVTSLTSNPPLNHNSDSNSTLLNPVDHLSSSNSQSSLVNVVQQKNPLLSFHLQFSFKKKISSKPNLVIEIVDLLLPFS